MPIPARDGPGRAWKAAFAAVLLASVACQVPTSALRAPGALGDQGEVYLYLEPLPPEARRLLFSIESVSAERSDGTEVPLQPVLSEVSEAAVERQTLLAFGRLAPGQYSGFLVRAGKATLAGDEGPAQLLVSKEAARLGAPFTAVRGRATVWSLTLRYAQSVQQGFQFAPAFSAVVPGRPIPRLAGYCSNSGGDSLTVFDKRSMKVVGVVPTGRVPLGMALGGVPSRLYVALSEEDQVQVLDAQSGEERGRIRLSPGDGPRELGLSPDGRLLVVANRESDTASFVDTASLTELNRVPTGHEPWALLVDRAGRRAYVFNRRGNSITVLDLANRTVAATVPTDPEPLRGQLNRAGTRLYVIHGGSAYMTVLAVPELTVANKVFVGLGAASLKVDPLTDLAYVGMQDESRINAYDPQALIPVDYVDLPGPTSFMTIDDDENTLLLLLPARRSVVGLDLIGRKRSGVEVGSDPYQVIVAGERR